MSGCPLANPVFMGSGGHDQGEMLDSGKAAL